MLHLPKGFLGKSGIELLALRTLACASGHMTRSRCLWPQMASMPPESAQCTQYLAENRGFVGQGAEAGNRI
jgi:hypothetical protein